MYSVTHNKCMSLVHWNSVSQ